MRTAEFAGGGFDGHVQWNENADTINGTAGDDTINGAGGNDILNGLGGIDTIDGGEGNDTLKGGAGGDDLDGGDDIDTASYAGSTAGVTVDLDDETGEGGDAEGDTLVNIENLIGSGQADELSGDGEDNILDGAAGNDTIAGGNGNDTLIGGAGNDVLDGGDDEDTASYATAAAAVTVSLATVAEQDTKGAGKDTLSNIENLIGSNFNDMLTGKAGDNNLLDGGAGTDTVTYAAATAGVFIDLAEGMGSDGDGGTDTLVAVENVIGSAFDDVLIGGAGANKLEGGVGDDILAGGLGKDTLIGGDGLDTADYGASAAAVTVNLALATAQAGGDAAGDMLTTIENVAGSELNDVLTGNGSENVLVGGLGNDTLKGAAGDDVLVGDEDDDTLFGDAGADTLVGGNGNDTATYAASTLAVTVSLLIGAGLGGDAEGDTIVEIETLIGSGKDDALEGDDDANRIEGGAGNDELSGGLGNDTLIGGAGIDMIDGGGAGDTINGFVGADSVDGGADTDTIVLTATSTDLNAAADGKIGNVEAVSAAGAGVSVTINLGLQTEGFEITGNGMADAITGGQGIDSIKGGGGNDTIMGFVGADIVDGEGGTGDTIVLAATSADLNSVADGDITNVEKVSAAAAAAAVMIDLKLQTEAFTITGSASADTITGGTAGDTIAGGGGNDTAKGFAGADSIDGGAGKDTIELTAASADLNAAVDAKIVNVEAVSATTAGAGVVIDLKLQTEAFTITGGDFADTITGGAGNDTLNGGEGNDTLIGMLGADTMDGGAGTGDTVDYSDSTAAVTVNLSVATAQSGGHAAGDKISNVENIVGSDFNDVLTGSNASNVIDGGAGNDLIQGVAVSQASGNTLIGGAGNDTVSYSNYTGAIIIDLNIQDGVNVQGPINFANCNDIFFELENGIGSNFTDTLIGDGGANVLQGGGDDDEITGGGGNDTLDGGAGNDKVTYDGGDVSIAGGAGTGDTLIVLAAATINLTAADQSIGDTAKVSGFEHVDASASAAVVSITGNAAKNTFTGGDLGDMLSGGAGNDTLLGGDGDDLLIGGVGGDMLDGGADNDTVSYSGSTVKVTIDLDAETAKGGDAQGDTLTSIENAIGSNLADKITGDADINIISGLAGNDTLDGGGDDDELNGGAGSDTLTGGTGADTINGGTGNDTINGFVGADTVDGGANNDTIVLTATAPDLNGVANNKILNVEAINASGAGAGVIINLTTQTFEGFIITGGTSADTISGGGGNDTFVGFVGADVLDGWTGTDTIALTGTSATLNAAANNDIKNIEVVSAAGAGVAVTIDLGLQTENYTIVGDTQIDTLTGGNGNDTLIGGALGDALNGGNGSDTASYVGSNAAVAVTVGGANTGGHAEGDTLTSIENLTGSSFDDTLNGDSSANVLNGGNGNDILSGSSGEDTLIGGAGNDTITGGGDTDTATYASATAAVTVNLSTAGAQNTGGAGSDTLVTIENLTGSYFNDVLTGDGLVNTLAGGVGNDTLTGGAEDDVFVFEIGYKDDTITDFVEGAGADDVIDLRDFGFADFAAFNAGITFDESTADLVISFTGSPGDTLTLVDVDTFAALNANDFLFV